MSAPTTTLLDDLASPDEDRVREALRSAQTHLRARSVSDEDRASIGERVLALSRRRGPKVRQAVAEIVEVLPDTCADAVLTALLTDRDPFVRRAAERASARRKKRQSEQAREDEQERVLGQILGRIELAASKSTRRLAERAVRLGLESFVRKLNHELMKAILPLEFALHRVGRQLDGRALDALDTEAMKRDLATAHDRVQFCRAIVAAATECSAAIDADFKQVRIAALVDEARAQLAVRLGPRAERLAFANEVDPKLCVEADRAALLQAFQNILQNAAEAYDDAAPSRAITVTSALARHGADVVLTFADEGRGMSEDQLARVFVPFGSSKPGGTGVGMVVSRRMVEEVHGGTLALESAPARGTKVLMTLPLGEGRARR